jgi:hypothetical protein
MKKPHPAPLSQAEQATAPTGARFVSAVDNAKQVAVVGSPSTNYEITLDLLGTATRDPLVGSMLMLAQPSGEGVELGLGMVTEVTTVNQWHTNPALKGVVKSRGSIPGMSGDTGDVRMATIKLQAAYRNDASDMEGKWRQSGPSMRMSPPTGAAIRKVTDEVLTELMAGEEDIHYLGTLHGSNDVRVPMQIRDFSGDRGAFHTGIFGISGSGKSAFTAYQFAGQLRHRNQGLIIIDPQGQWSHEQGLPFSLQGFAAELGREVMVRRISEDMRLEKDAPLFGELLGKTRFVREIMKMATETQEILVEELVKVLKGIDDWPDLSSASLLDELLLGLRRPNVLRRVYSDNTKRVRLMVALSEILGQDCTETIDGEPIEDVTRPEYRDYRLDTAENRRDDALTQFAALHNLFSATNPGGGARHSLWGTVSRVFDKDARGANPAPVLILDMSTSGGASWIGDILADEDSRKAQDALDIIDQDAIKAAILRQVFRTLKGASESAFRNADNLNTNVALDEAWRYAPPPHLASDEEIKHLSIDLSGYARDFRKFGIGMTFITQTTRSINQDIWDQMTVRVLGYGLAGADVEKVAEQVDDRDHLKLYKGFAPPDSTNPKVYPFMLVGPVSPLSFSKAPILLAAYTDFQNFRDDNAEWITQIRLSMGANVMDGTPTRPNGGGLTLPSRASRAGRTLAGPPRGAAALRQVEQVRAHRDTGGVDPAVGTGLGTDPTFGSGLNFLDGDEPPF